MRRRMVTLLTVLSLITGFHLLLAPAASAHPYCGQVWGSLPKSAGGMSLGELVDVRAGRHACFDRLVLDIDDARLTGWSVRYVDRIVQDGSGFVVPVRGGARLEIVVRVWVDLDADFPVGSGDVVSTAGFRTFRQAVWAGSFEGVSTVGLGVRARLPFRAFVLAGPGDGSRLVVDVGHQWCAPGHSVC